MTAPPARWLNVYGQFLYSEPKTRRELLRARDRQLRRFRQRLLFSAGSTTSGDGQRRPAARLRQRRRGVAALEPAAHHRIAHHRPRARLGVRSLQPACCSRASRRPCRSRRLPTSIAPRQVVNYNQSADRRAVRRHVASSRCAAAIAICAAMPPCWPAVSARSGPLAGGRAESPRRARPASPSVPRRSSPSTAITKARRATASTSAPASTSTARRASAPSGRPPLRCSSRPTSAFSITRTPRPISATISAAATTPWPLFWTPAGGKRIIVHGRVRPLHHAIRTSATSTCRSSLRPLVVPRHRAHRDRR